MLDWDKGKAVEFLLESLGKLISGFCVHSFTVCCSEG